MNHPNALDQQLENLRTLQQSYDQIAGAAEAYNVGKTQLAAAITSKGVETSPTESYPEMAGKVNAISQETYEINGGEMYAKQLFGAANNNIVPGYWNLYEIMAQLLSDGRLVNYGGILLAEYYKGYDSLVLSGAGAGGAYVVSDKDGDGNFIMYTNDTTHTWATEFDGKGNRWVAYCFADEYHDFQITDTNTSPRSIFIGRNVGVIKLLQNSRTEQVVITDNNALAGIDANGYTQAWGKRVALRNLGDITKTIMLSPQLTESIYIRAESIHCRLVTAPYISSIIIEAQDFAKGGNAGFIDGYMIGCATSYLSIDSSEIDAVLGNVDARDIVLRAESVNHINRGNITISGNIYLFYITNDKSQSFNLSLTGTSHANSVMCVLQDGWCKPLMIGQFNQLTEQNIYTYILQRLKQDEEDCGDGVTITLGATNLAKLTSEESVQLLDDLTNIYGYTFA